MKQSETITVKRSEINLNPYNPKRHSSEQIKLQKKNLKKVGYLGGVTWNKNTGNLIDGHRRVMAMDDIYKYDGTPETDYEIKVESVSMTDKEEKQQMTYMALGNSQADYNLVAQYIDDIDATEIGISDADLKAIQELRVDDFMDEMPLPMEEDFAPVTKEPKEPVYVINARERTADEILEEHNAKPKMTVEEVKGAKKHCDGVANKHWEKIQSFIVVRFDEQATRRAFCEVFDIVDSENVVVDGASILDFMDV